MALMWTAPGRVDMVREGWRKSATLASGEAEMVEIYPKTQLVFRIFRLSFRIFTLAWPYWDF
jgi:hypothetical protein